MSIHNTRLPKFNLIHIPVHHSQVKIDGLSKAVTHVSQIIQLYSHIPL